MKKLTLALVFLAAPAHAQSWPTDDPVLQRIWEIGMEQSQTQEIAQALMDSIGPRLTGTPILDAANDWAAGLAGSFGADARKEQYGTWIGWERGVTHVDLISPRVRTLEATLLAYGGGTAGPVEGEVALIPAFSSQAEAEAWLETIRGKFVAISFPQPTCRPDSHYEEFGTAGALQRLRQDREAARQAFRFRVPNAPGLRVLLQSAGAAGILESNWAGDIGINTIYSTNVADIPTLDFSCEDYGLLWRLAENDQAPTIRVDATARYLGDVPVYNTLAEIRGRDLPDEYVMLSAHFDSWDGASGATDNGTGTTVMLEALRILAEAYPNPRRTILMALWGGEEQGLNGSRRFAAMHPDIVDGLQGLFNQDIGTGRIASISAQGLSGAEPHLADWISKIPPELAGEIEVDVGTPSSGGSDHSSFICAGAPAFNLRSVSWSYGPHTWHTNRDTFDKVVFDEVRANAVLTAMLVYLASEDDRVGRQRSELPPGPGGQQREWPTCQPGDAEP